MTVVKANPILIMSHLKVCSDTDGMLGQDIVIVICCSMTLRAANQGGDIWPEGGLARLRIRRHCAHKMIMLDRHPGAEIQNLSRDVP